MDARVKDEPSEAVEPRAATADPTSSEVDDRRDQSVTIVARDVVEKYDRVPSASEKPATQRRVSVARVLLPWVRRLATLAIVLVAVLVSLVAWDQYLTAPWTRDGRVRVQVASVTPQVSGQIKELHVADNQFVHKGDTLYVIDRFDFEVTLRTSKAQLQQKAADQQVKERQFERRQHLSNLATTPEEQQTFAGNAVQAQAAFEAMQQQVAQAEINLNRTRVRSPVNGYVTNLLLRAGDYAHQGVSNVSVIDTDSYWIDGYFEETKMARVCVGDRVEAKLMGYAQPIIGRVATVTRGVSNSNAAAGAQGLPNVDPVYTWVRLAQRVPVRVAIDEVPPGVPLVSGMTATVTIRDDTASAQPTWLDRTRSSLGDMLDGPPARPGCIPAVTTERAPTQSIPLWEAQPTPTPEQINPGLAPDLNAPPRYK